MASPELCLVDVFHFSQRGRMAQPVRMRKCVHCWPMHSSGALHRVAGLPRCMLGSCACHACLLNAAACGLLQRGWCAPAHRLATAAIQGVWASPQGLLTAGITVALRQQTCPACGLKLLPVQVLSVGKVPIRTGLRSAGRRDVA